MGWGGELERGGADNSSAVTYSTATHFKPRTTQWFLESVDCILSLFLCGFFLSSIAVNGSV